MKCKVLYNVCRNNDCQYFLKTSESLKKKNYLGGRWQAKVEQRLVRKSMKYSQRIVRGLWQTKMDVNSLLLPCLSLLVFMVSFSFASRKCHHNVLNISFLGLNHTLHVFIYLSPFFVILLIFSYFPGTKLQTILFLYLWNSAMSAMSAKVSQFPSEI